MAPTLIIQLTRQARGARAASRCARCSTQASPRVKSRRRERWRGNNRQVRRCESSCPRLAQARPYSLTARNSTIYAGAPADAVFCVEKGCLKLTVVSPRGKAAVVGMVGPGDFFGEGCLAGQPLRTASAAAMIETTLVRLERRTMVAALQEPSGGLTELFLAHLLSRTARMEEDLVDQLFNSSEKTPCAGAAPVSPLW
jgi:CRP-like cAMP-binding protein